MAMATAPAQAAENEGPFVFDSGGSGQALQIAVGLPAALADGLAPVLENLPGIALEGNDLTINLASVLAELELPLAGDQPGAVTAMADATSLTGSLAGLLDQLSGGTQCLDTPIDVVVPPGAETPLVSLKLLDAECTADEDGRVSIARSRIADLEINLAGALALLPAEASGALTDTLDEVTDTVQETVLDPLVGSVLTPVQDAINDTTGIGLDLSEAIRVPELLDLPLVSIDLLESVTTSVTEGDQVRSVSSASLAGVQLLGTICVPNTTYTSEAFATGEPGGNGYATSIPPIDLEICDTSNLAPILRLLEQEGVLGDILVNLGDGQLKPIAELLEGTGLPVQDVVDALEGLLGTLGVSTVVQGQEVNAVRSADGRQAGVGVSAFRIAVQPLHTELAGTPLEGLGVSIAGLGNDSVVAAGLAPEQPKSPEKPAPEPEPEPSLPRTGGGLAILGILALGGAFGLRRRQ